jgi:hypothetical protein
MSTVARRFTASPARLSSAAWKAISALICKQDNAAGSEFEKVAGVASSLINERFFAGHPLVLKNRGPRLRIYCVYGEDATTSDGVNEDELSWSPTENEWHAFLPCSEEQEEEMAAYIKGKSAKFSIYNIETGVPDDETNDVNESAATTASVDWEAFKKL